MLSRFVGATAICLFHVLAIAFVSSLSAKVAAEESNKKAILKCSDNQRIENNFNEPCTLNTMCVLQNYKITQDDNIFHPQGAVRQRCLIFRNNIINMLPVEFFRIYTALLYIDLSNSRLEHIQDRTFAIGSLLELNLSGNDLTELSAEAFAGAIRLQKLDLSHNMISSIDPKTFGDLRSLAALSLAHNKLSNQSFSLNDNEISIDWRLESLKTLDLSHNKIFYYDAMPFQSFANMPKLEELFLQHNEIPIDYGAFASNHILKTLDFSYNNMPYFDINLLLSVQTLENLYLNGNGISYASQVDLSDVRSSFPRLKSIGIVQNTFACEVLASVIRKLDKAGIEMVVNESDFVRNARNIRGVRCI